MTPDHDQALQMAQQEIHRLEIQLADTEAELLEMRKERDDWAMKFINMCKQYAEIRWPGLDKEIKAI